MAWFRATGYQPEDMTAAIRATACRAAEVDNWFRIGKEKLTAIGAAFSKKAKVTENVKEMQPVIMPLKPRGIALIPTNK